MNTVPLSAAEYNDRLRRAEEIIEAHDSSAKQRHAARRCLAEKAKLEAASK